MKKIACPLRIELAQYRELAAFVQFGSDLSKDTLDRLHHGGRIVEILKQPQYMPMPVEKQVLLLYALINKHLSDVRVERLQAFENDFLAFMDDYYSDITDEIRETNEISDGLEQKIVAAIAEFKKRQKYANEA